MLTMGAIIYLIDIETWKSNNKGNGGKNHQSDQDILYLPSTVGDDGIIHKIFSLFSEVKEICQWLGVWACWAVAECYLGVR